MKTTETILNYIFKELASYEENLFEQAVDNDKILSTIVSGMLRFCLDFNISGKEEFYTEWDKIIEKQLILARYPVFEEIVYRGTKEEEDDTPDGRSVKKYRIKEDGAIGELINRYRKDMEFRHVITSFRNKYSEVDLLILLTNHLSDMQAELKETERNNIFIYDYKKVDIRRTFTDMLIHFKYFVGDNEAVSIIDNKYKYQLNSIAYNIVRDDRLIKEESMEQANDIRMGVLESLLKKPVEKRQPVFLHTDHQINIMRTLHSWASNASIDFLRKRGNYRKYAEYYLYVNEDSFCSIDELDIPHDSVELWQSKNVVDAIQYKMKNTLDSVTFQAIMNLRKDKNKLKDNNKEYLICCCYCIGIKKSEIGYCFKIEDPEVLRTILQRLSRWVEREIINIKK